MLWASSPAIIAILIPLDWGYTEAEAIAYVRTHFEVEPIEPASNVSECLRLRIHLLSDRIPDSTTSITLPSGVKVYLAQLYAYSASGRRIRDASVLRPSHPTRPSGVVAPDEPLVSSQLVAGGETVIRHAGGATIVRNPPVEPGAWRAAWQ